VVSDGVPVPNVVGLQQAAARTAITNAGLTVDTVTPQHSVLPIGQVLSETPAATTLVEGGSAVNLVVSDGVPVPDLVGLQQAAVQTAITNASLIVGTVTQQHSTMPIGQVLGQSPASGTLVAAGSGVNLAVSDGVPVPDVVDMTHADAETALTWAGLTLGTVTEAYSDTVASGTVISQDPVADEGVATGSAVSLVVSKGPQPTLGCFGGTTNNISFDSLPGKSGDTVLLVSASAALFLVGSRRQRHQSIR
jgi:beta-lactam-binding protein with PASTA domain